MGEQFVTHDHFKRFLGQYPTGVPDSAKGLHMVPVPLADGMKSLLTGAGSALVYPEFYPEIPQWWPPMVMRQLVTGGTTATDLIEYASVASWTNAAGVVAEAVDESTGLKPESAITFQRVSAPVRTIAHWVPITRRALSDAHQIRTYVDEFLSQGLDQAFESEMISGDGTGEHFSGILHTTGVQHQAFDTDMAASIRKAMTKITTLGGTVTGVLMDPASDESFDLLKDSIGRYFGAGPFGTGPSTIWGRPRVVSYKMSANQAIVGDFRTCVLWDREQASIQLADQHADFFIRNIVALLAEARAAFGILKPQLLCVVELVHA
jgi:HK97 family phage major capsid protein